MSKNDVVVIMSARKEYSDFNGKIGILTDIGDSKSMVLLEFATNTRGSLSHTFYNEDMIYIGNAENITIK